MPEKVPNELKKINILATRIAEKYGKGGQGILEAMLDCGRKSMGYYDSIPVTDIRPQLNAMMEGKPLHIEDQCVAMSALFTCLALEQGLNFSLKVRPGHVWVNYQGRDYNPGSKYCSESYNQTAELPSAAIMGIMWEQRSVDAIKCKDKERALSYLNRAIRLFPMSGSYATRAIVYLDYFKDLERARTDSITAVQIQPNWWFPYSVRAAIALEENDPNTALEMLNQAAVYENNAKVCQIRSKALQMKGKTIRSTWYQILSFLKSELAELTD